MSFCLPLLRQYINSRKSDANSPVRSRIPRNFRIKAQSLSANKILQKSTTGPLSACRAEIYIWALFNIAVSESAETVYQIWCATIPCRDPSAPRWTVPPPSPPILRSPSDNPETVCVCVLYELCRQRFLGSRLFPPRYNFVKTRFPFGLLFCTRYKKVGELFWILYIFSSYLFSLSVQRSTSRA